ncbi:MAG: Epoxyqueuosine (oQ) reductase QueG [Acidobacteriaceae bacterium]|nr:Epoxyqueuosine (oQ) reductase QueG [Acidobacteriaceae bacterium]
MPQISHISALVKQSAHDAGFELSGIAPVEDFPELSYFPQWIAAGHAAEMKYMESKDRNGKLKRASLKSTFPWARSVIVCAINYNTAHPYSTEERNPQNGWIARYAWGSEDYHNAVMRRLRTVESRLLQEHRIASGESCECGRELQTRCYVDTGPVVERVYAKYAGIGWTGKNTCLLNQKMGSWLFLGVILTSLELAPDLPAADRCGTCTRCIDACPTDALIAPYKLDSNKCISYLTIEKRGDIPEEMRAGIGRQVFGCDICQDVCPWNRKAPASSAQEFQPHAELVNPALEWLAEISEEDFREKFRTSAIRRSKRSGLRRNALIAMGNSGEARFLTKLQRLTNDEDPVVAKAARWAISQLKNDKHPEFRQSTPC